jgi:hypothetical protein
VRWLLESSSVVLFVQYLLRPLLSGVLVGLSCRALGLPARPAFLVAAAVFLVGCVLFNSRMARHVEEALIDWLGRTWQQLSVNLFPPLVQFIVSVFKNAMEGIDRLLYSVDEWLRFRSGEGQWTFAWKLALGMVWFLVTYIIRFHNTLLIEPYANPVKHFPVVTVSAKLLIPFTDQLNRQFLLWLVPLLGVVAGTLEAWGLVFFLPGLFGFLVWEFVQNWRLYRANQPTTLRPDIIGHHGETLPGLLRLGFHSGTVPKLYRKLRRAERRSGRTRGRSAARRHRAALHHVEAAVRHFVERELLALLNASHLWDTAPVTVGRISLGCQRILIELRCPQRGAASAWIAFREQAGRLLASVPQTGWIAGLSGGPRQALLVALAGWFQMAGAEFIGESLTPSAGPADETHGEGAQGLIDRPADLRGGTVPSALERPPLPELSGKSAHPLVARPMLPLTPAGPDSVPITWHRWVQIWQQDHAEGPPPASLHQGEPLLALIGEDSAPAPARGC